MRIFLVVHISTHTCMEFTHTRALAHTHTHTHTHLVYTKTHQSRQTLFVGTIYITSENKNGNYFYISSIRHTD